MAEELILQASPEQLALIERAANLLGASVPKFILDAACRQAEATVVGQELNASDTQDFQLFAESLDDPAEPAEGLQRLASVRPPWPPAGR